MLDATSTDSWILRLGSGAAVAGSLLAMAGNLLHPSTPMGENPEGVARAIAESQVWAVHLVIVVG